MTEPDAEHRSTTNRRLGVGLEAMFIVVATGALVGVDAGAWSGVLAAFVAAAVLGPPAFAPRRVLRWTGQPPASNAELIAGHTWVGTWWRVQSLISVFVLAALVFMAVPGSRPTAVRVTASAVFAAGGLGTVFPPLAQWFRRAPTGFSVAAAVPVGIATALLFTRGPWFQAALVGGLFGAAVGLLVVRQRKAVRAMDVESD